MKFLNSRSAHICSRRSPGFTLIELMVVVAVIGIFASAGVVTFSGWADRQRGRNAAGELSGLLFLARSQAVRTGVNHIAYFGIDDSGNPLVASNGVTPLSALLIEDVDGDLALDSDEVRLSIPMQSQFGIAWGRSQAPNLISSQGGVTLGDPFSGTPIENTAAELASPANFRHPTDSTLVQSRVLLAPDGTPRAFNSLASTPIGQVGSGDGTIYLNDGLRDYAVVISAIGAVKALRWDQQTSGWK